MSTKKRIGADFTTGSIPRHMLGFAIPYMLATTLQIVYSLVDMVIVGHFVNSYALSAVSVSSQIVVFCTTMCIGYCFGGQVYISQALGRGRRELLNSAIGTLFTVVLCIALVVTAAILLLRETILQLLNTPEQSYAMSMEYLTICGGGLIFTYGYNLVSSVLRGMGDSKRPLLFIAIASVTNLLLDLLFTGLLGWGVAGAAWATIIGQTLSFVFAVVYLCWRREQFAFDFCLRSFRIDRTAFAEMSRLGGVLMIQYAVIYISMLFVNAMVNTRGVYASAAFGVGMKLDDIINKVSQAFQAAALAMVGQCFAAGDHARVRRIVHTAWLFVGAMYGVYLILYLTLREAMFGLFTADMEVISLSGVYVSAIVWGYPGFISKRGTDAVVQGTGFARLGFITSLLDGLIMRIGLCWLLGVVLDMGLYGFFLGYAVAVYGTSVPGLIYYLSGAWKRRRAMVR